MALPSVIQAALLIGLPLILKIVAKWNKFLNWLGPTALCYLIGILWGNLPVAFEAKVSLGLAQAAVPLALPMLLFSMDLRCWRRLAITSLISFGLAVAAVLMGIVAVTKFCPLESADPWRIAGMLIGVYIGGTANMSAIGMALRVPTETFVLVSAADVLSGGIYFLVLMTVAQRLLLLILPAFVSDHLSLKADLGRTDSNLRFAANWLCAPALAVVLVVVSAGLSWIFWGALHEAFVVLSITTLGLLCSLAPNVRAWPASYEMGEYLLLIFSLAIGSLANFRGMLNQGSEILIFTTAALVVCVGLQVILAAIFRIDADTTIMTSTATIFGPAFVGPVAASIKNRELIVTGLVTSLAGFAVANYVGIAVAYFLRP
ncbi:MAG: DUF819 family protein [Elusimicrobia bacterium]|nr:DUF819 family protein [Elusimicrobiota bacterium]